MPMPHSPTELLSELIAIPSVNPMGLDVSGEIYLEHRLTDWLEGYFQGLGLPCVRQPVEPGRENIVARLDGPIPPEQGGPVVLWEVHQDTVPVDAMTIPPFEPLLREGRIFGRGACDVKGGMASMLAALARLAQARSSSHTPPNHNTPNMPTIVLACTVNEEFGFSGAKALAASWSESKQDPGGGSNSEANAAVRSLLGRRPDMAIVAEPTDLNVVVAHKGGVRWFLHALGQAAHSSKPHLGDNAIYRAARAALAIERYQTEALPAQDEHRWCGRPTLSATTVHGGISSNTIPDRVTLEIERRNVPGEDPLAVRQAVIDYLNEALPKDAPLFDHAPPSIVVNALSDSHNDSLAQRLLQSSQEICPQAQRIGADYGTDAPVIAQGGVPTVVFGPGSIDQAHTADEWVAIEQLDRAADILVRFVESFSH